MSVSLANLLTPLKAGEAKEFTATLAEHRGNKEQESQILQNCRVFVAAIPNYSP